MRSSGSWRILLDCSTFLSGIFYPLGKPHKILDLWMDKKFELYLTKVIFEEYVRKTKDLTHRLKKTEESVDLWFTLFRKLAIFIDPEPLPKDLCRDPDDVKYLEAAKGGRIDFLISSDNDLLILRKFADTKIVLPSDFLKMFAKK